MTRPFSYPQEGGILNTEAIEEITCTVMKRLNLARANSLMLAAVFVITFSLLFIGMSRIPNVYDEGIVLTGAMRVLTGQVPHRDFYANYGPAQFYLIAGLFRLFGESLLVERVFDLLVKSAYVTLIYFFVLSFSRKHVAILTTCAVLLWLFGTNAMSGTAVIPVSLLNLLAAIVFLPIFGHPPSRRRMLVAGVLSGATALFRYDVGIALLAIGACALTIAAYTSWDCGGFRFRAAASAYWPCLAGFGLIVLPVAVLYLKCAPFADFRYDIITYPAHSYHRSRNLPFPKVRFRHIDDLADYLPIPIILVALYTFASVCTGSRGSERRSTHTKPLSCGFLIIFALLSSMMYLKGIVRISPAQLYLCTVPSLLLLAMLFESAQRAPKVARLAIAGLVGLSGLAALWSGGREAKQLLTFRSSVPAYLIQKMNHRVLPEEAAWCEAPNPLTTGFCFNPGDDRVRATHYIVNHTVSNAYLFEGLRRHDIVFANDNILYFASQRLPASKWSHFDPGVQNRSDIQMNMIAEFERLKPPLVVLDSEFESIAEPNESSKSSGVTALDGYIHANYSYVETFGYLTILKRMDQPSS